MEDLSTLNLAIIEKTTGPGRPTTLLRKRKLSKLNSEECEIMEKKIKLDKDKYVA